MSLCHEPVAMPEDACTHRKMGLPVVFDAKQKVCSIDKSPSLSEHYASFTMKTGVTGKKLYMSCAPVTRAGYDSVLSIIDKDVLQTCNTFPRDLSKYDLAWVCKQGPDTFDAFVEATKALCANADFPGSVAPVFESRTFY